jgi:hypothetical protein
MNKLQIDKKLIIDISSFMIMLLGSQLHNNNIPGGLLIVVFSSITWSLLLLLGIFYLFKSNKFESNNILSGVFGLFLFILPLSYSFQVFGFPGDVLVLFYSIVTIPILGIICLTLYLRNRKEKYGNYYFNMLLRIVLLFIMASTSMIYTAPRL